MTLLYILAAVIIFFALVLNIRAHIHVEYEKDLIAYAKWAFVKIPLLPAKEKAPAQKKKEPPAKKEETPPAPETPKEPKPKGPNPLATIYENEQISGIMEIFGRLLMLLDKFGRRFINSFVIDEMFLDIDITKGDSAQTAEEYGKLCRIVFPAVGAVCANCNVKKYSVNVEPDYIANPGIRAAFSMEISLNPRKLINAVLAFAFGTVFKIGIRLIKDLKPKNPAAATENAQDTQSGKTEEQSCDTNQDVPVIESEKIMNDNENNTESGVE